MARGSGGVGLCSNPHGRWVAGQTIHDICRMALHIKKPPLWSLQSDNHGHGFSGLRREMALHESKLRTPRRGPRCISISASQITDGWLRHLIGEIAKNELTVVVANRNVVNMYMYSCSRAGVSRSPSGRERPKPRPIALQFNGHQHRATQSWRSLVNVRIETVMLNS